MDKDRTGLTFLYSARTSPSDSLLYVLCCAGGGQLYAVKKKTRILLSTMRTSRRTSPLPASGAEAWDVAEKAVTRGFKVVGAGRFELPTPCSQSETRQPKVQ